MSHPLYQLDDVKQIYGLRTVLDIPRLTLHQGEILALVGPSGAGKSTLLRLLALLETPATGTVQLGLDNRQVTVNTATIEDKRQLAMVFQRPVLMSRSVRYNVAYGLKLRGERNGTARINDILGQVDMRHLAAAKPHTLSGGEMQRVSIARAVILEPRVLLLDEPTANLDRQNVKIIENLIREQHQQHNTSIILVTHNIFQARRLATRIAFMLDGNLIEITPTEEFFTSPQDPRTADFISGDLIY
ncbi:ATP-binding cassette domain-containing protein [Chloroflexota bacterium]